MVRDLNFDLEIVGCPIVREPDGLAKSSRNTYLSDKERQAALILHKSLEEGKKLVEQGERNAAVIIDKIRNVIETEPLAKIDYVEIVNADTMETTGNLSGRVLAAIAVYIGKARLIDNFITDVR